LSSFFYKKIYKQILQCRRLWNPSFVQTSNKNDKILVSSLKMRAFVLLLLTAALLSVVYATETSCFGRCLVEASKMKDKEKGHFGHICKDLCSLRALSDEMVEEEEQTRPEPHRVFNKVKPHWKLHGREDQKPDSHRKGFHHNEPHRPEPHRPEENKPNTHRKAFDHEAKPHEIKKHKPVFHEKHHKISPHRVIKHTQPKTMNDAGLNMLKSFEGFSACKYQDPAGYWTIGYGHLIRPGEYFTCISEAEATQLLLNDVSSAEQCVRDYVHVSLNGNQFSALVDFTYNLGCGSLASSTLLREVNARNFGTVCGQLERWVYAGGQVLPGLVRRRQAECQLFNS
jgi:lysozyme